MASAGEDEIRRVKRPIPGQFVVQLADSVSDVRGTAQSLARSYGGRLRFVYEHALRGFSVRMSAGQALRLSGDTRVASVEEDGIVTAVGKPSAPSAPWGLDRIDQRDLPLNGTYAYNTSGSAVRAYVIDTGIQTTHKDFGGRASVGIDTVGDGRNGSDCNGHGTHVAGTIGGSKYGVAKGVKLIAVRVLGCSGSGADSGVIAGVDWVTAQRNANPSQPAVANMSLGGGTGSVNAAVRSSIAAGVTYAVAAGNGDAFGNAADACNESPAQVVEALTVSATDSADNKASFANYGPCVDVFAPGVNITSDWNNGKTRTISGTSMATPHVAGAAALYLGLNPTASPATVAGALVGYATRDKVVSAGPGSPNRLLYTGCIGIVCPNIAPTANFTYACSFRDCSFTDASSDEGAIVSRAWDFGDGAVSTATNPLHSYTADGMYTVSLTVTDDQGATGLKTREVTVSSTDPDPGTPTLTNGVPSTDTNGATGSWKYYKIQVPNGTGEIVFALSGPTASCGPWSCDPDLDLYVAREAKPTLSTYVCRSISPTSDESCTGYTPTAGWWYLGIYVYGASTSINYSVQISYS